MTQVNIVLMNVRGITERIKWKKILMYCHDKGADICCMQERHSTETNSVTWPAEAGKIASHGDSSWRGTVIFVNKAYNVENKRLK